MSSSSATTNVRLPPEVNRILFIRNLPYKIAAEELFDLFSKYGPIRQIRIGSEKETRGTAFVVYEDIFDAKKACESLSGFNVQGRYLICLYYQPTKQLKKMDLEKKKDQIEALKQKYGPILATLSSRTPLYQTPSSVASTPRRPV